MPKMTFSSLLASAPMGLSKEAVGGGGVESPDQVQMEQDFGRLAYMFLKDRAAGLIPYLLGFEIVDREEDGSRAVGIFGFKLGEDYYYVPAFFTNGQIKGMDLLYSKATNMFMPLRESWINNIVNKQTIALGDGVGNIDNLRRTFEQPRFDFLAVPPNLPIGTVPKVAAVVEKVDNNSVKGTDDVKAIKDEKSGDDAEVDTDPSQATKIACDKCGKKDCACRSARIAVEKDCTCDKKAMAVIKRGFDTWNHLQRETADMMDKDAKFQEAFAGAIMRMTGQPIEKSAEGSELLSYLQNYGGPRAVGMLFKQLTTDHGFAKAALSFYPSVESMFVHQFDASLAPQKQAAKVEVVTQQTDYIDGKAKKRLVRDGFTIHDTREEPEKSEVYDVDYIKRFQSPDKSGLYNLLLRNGGATQAWVFMPSEAGKNNACLVVETEGKNYFLAEPSAVFVRGDEIVEGKNPYEDAVDLEDMEIGKRYALLDAKGNASAPFEIESLISEDGKRTKARIRFPYTNKIERPTYGHDFETLGTKSRQYNGPSVAYAASVNEPKYLEFADYHSSVIGGSGNDTWVIPANWKALELQEKKKSDGDSYEANRVMEDMFQPGTLTDVEVALNKKAFHNLTVDTDGIEYNIRFDNTFIDGRPMNYKAAMVRLVTKYGLGVDDAEQILKEANEHMKSRKFIKFGQIVGGHPTSNLVGYSMPADPGLATGIDSFTGATTTMPQIDLLRGQTIGQTKPINSVQPGFNLGGEAQMDLQASQLAQQAGQAGQKQVFDHAAIGGLAKVYDSGSVIDTYIPELTKALDRIGRILFLFYWKNEEFSERYGSEDMSEMEDAIRGVFKSFGDLVLKLKQKSVEPEDSGNAVM